MSGFKVSRAMIAAVLFCFLACSSVFLRISAESGKDSLSMHANFKQACVECHEDVHKGVRGTDCSVCHTPAVWEPVDAARIHSGDFKLTGQHLTVSCEECHIKEVYVNTPKECYECHWIRKQDDPFKTRLGSDCGACHTTMSWIPARWNHGIETGFPLKGSHRGISCDKCHPGFIFQGAQDSCYSCHSGDYNGAKDPDHKAAGYGLDCASCHNTTSWHSASNGGK